MEGEPGKQDGRGEESARGPFGFAPRRQDFPGDRAGSF